MDFEISSEAEDEATGEIEMLLMDGKMMNKYTKMKENSQEYELIRSKRKSLALQVKGDGTVVVRRR